MLIILDPIKINLKDAKVYTTQEELEETWKTPLDSILPSLGYTKTYSELMKSSLGGVTIGSVYYRTMEDQNTAGDIIERNTYIKVQNITYTYSRYYAFLTIIEDAAGIISVCQGYVEAEKLLSNPCIVEIDRIPISIRERIIKLINV
jgi:hypothetical protein